MKVEKKSKSDSVSPGLQGFISTFNFRGRRVGKVLLDLIDMSTESFNLLADRTHGFKRLLHHGIKLLDMMFEKTEFLLQGDDAIFHGESISTRRPEKSYPQITQISQIGIERNSYFYYFLSAESA